MFFATLLTIAAAAAAVSASPVERLNKRTVLPLKHYSNFTSIKNILNRGTARIHKINGIATTSVGTSFLTSGTITNDLVSYNAPIIIGGKTWELIVDTGSSNTWCGATTSCEKTSTGVSTGHRVSVSYGSGSFSGTEYTDTVDFGGLTVTEQSIGAATSSTGFSGTDGIIGFGPVDLTEDTVASTTIVPTFMDNLLSQGLITSEILGVSFKPETGSDEADANGELTLGGIDTTKYTGTLTYFPKLTTGTASLYWGIAIASFIYGTTSLATAATGIVDTGTTLIYIPTAAYTKFLTASGGKTDALSGLAIYTTKPTSSFIITFGTTAYTLTPAMYLVPTAEYAAFGLTTGKYYAWINDGGASGVNTIIGQKFLENFYSVFDTTNSRIGFATAA